MIESLPVTAPVGTTVLIAGIPGRPIYVKRVFFVADTAATNVQFQDTLGNNLTGNMKFAIGQPGLLPGEPDPSQGGWFEINPGVGLQVVTSTGGIAGIVQFIQ